jgi:hypothetical protein
MAVMVVMRMLINIRSACQACQTCPNPALFIDSLTVESHVLHQPGMVQRLLGFMPRLVG